LFKSSSISSSKTSKHQQRDGSKVSLLLGKNSKAAPTTCPPIFTDSETTLSDVAFAPVTPDASSSPLHISSRSTNEPFFQNSGHDSLTPVSTQTNSPSSKNSTPVSSEVDELRQKLKEMSFHNHRSDLLLSQMKVLEEESQRKDEKLRYLNDQLHGIQRGLSQIDDERSVLQKQVQQLEHENCQIKQQLKLREEEVLVLVKRCSSQECKMSESNLLRSKTEQLQQEIDELRAALSEKDFIQNSLEHKTQELDACKAKLEHSKRDHDALADTLRNCLANIKTLTRERESWEDERRRLRHHAQVELEKERLKHASAMNDLKEQLQARQSKIDKLEEFMRDKSMTSLMLRKANAELNKQKTQADIKLEECERQADNLYKENRAKLEKIKELEASAKVAVPPDEWAIQLENKDNTIATLEKEISRFMTKGMSTSEELELLQEESAKLEELVETLQEKVKAFDGWEEERDAMLEYMAVTQSQIQELMEEVVTLQLENDEYEEEKRELLAENHALKSSYSSTNEVECLKSEFLKKEEAWKQLEQNLKKKIVSLQSGKFETQEGLETKLELAQEKIRHLELSVTAGNEDTASLKKELAESRKTAAQNVDQVIILEREVNDARLKMEEREKNCNEVHNQTQTWKAELDQTYKQLHDANAVIENLEITVSEQRAELDAFVHIAEEDASIFQTKTMDLEKELTEAWCINKEIESKLTVETTTHQEEINKLKSTVSLKNEELSQVQQELSTKETDIVRLREALAEANERKCEEVAQLNDQLSNLQAEITHSDIELQKTKTSLVLKEDELREVWAIEMKDLEEEVSKLHEEVGTKESEIENLVGKLQMLSSLQHVERENLVAEKVNTLA